MTNLVFHFKKFDIEQPEDGFKINTDGVLLGAVATANSPKKILDIGTGTGVIAMMMAQRFPEGRIDALEPDAQTANLAGKNFENSPFVGRLHVISHSFQDYFVTNNSVKYDLIVTNPPFFINSLGAGNSKINQAKHTQSSFFDDLIATAVQHLDEDGLCWMILPVELAGRIKIQGALAGLFVQCWITVSSFEHKTPHRVIFSLGFKDCKIRGEKLVIYSAPRQYSGTFAELLGEFFTIF